jgi:hypothetical protein
MGISLLLSWEWLTFSINEIGFALLSDYTCNNNCNPLLSEMSFMFVRNITYNK